MLERLTSDKGALVVIVGCFIVAQAALLSLLPVFIGGIALGLLTGTAIGKAYIEKSAPSDLSYVTDKRETVVETEIVPYDSWPDACYVCGEDIDESMETRGQFVVHKGESDSKTKAVPLCEECTWTHSTLVDNHDRLVEVYDGAETVTEL